MVSKRSAKKIVGILFKCNEPKGRKLGMKERRMRILTNKLEMNARQKLVIMIMIHKMVVIIQRKKASSFFRNVSNESLLLYEQ